MTRRAQVATGAIASDVLYRAFVREPLRARLGIEVHARYVVAAYTRGGSLDTNKTVETHSLWRAFHAMCRLSGEGFEPRLSRCQSGHRGRSR